MKKKKFLWVIALFLFIICAVFIRFNSDKLFIRSFHIQYSDVVNAALDRDGNQIIIDSAGQRLLKVDAAGKAEFAVTKGFNQGKGLNNVVKVLTDEQKHIFLLNTIKEEGGYRIRREEIVEYSPDGKYLGIVTAIDHETPVLNEDISGLYLLNGEIAYIITGDNSFELYDSKNELIGTYESEGIKNLVISYAVNPDTHEIYYSTRQGKILKYIEDGSSELLYDANSCDYLSVPRDLSLDGEGNLLFTDIGLRTVSKLDKEGNLSHVIYDGEVGIDTISKYIYSYLETSNGVIAVASDHIVFLKDGESISSYGADYTTENCVYIAAVWAALATLAVISLFVLFKLIVLIIKKGTKTFKISIGVICGAMAIAGIFILMVIPDFEARLMDSVLKRAQTISDIIQIVVPTENYKELDRTNDYLSDDYNKVRDSIKEVFSTDNEDINDFYCVLYTVHDNVITGTFSLQEYSGAVYPYDWPFDGSDEQGIIASGIGNVYTNVSTSEGTYLFVLNPLFDENHNVVGLIEVGTDLNSFHEETNSMIAELLLNVIAITIVIILISLEIVIFVHGRSEYLKKKQEGTLVRIPNDLLRIIVFGVFFITNMTTSFLSLHAMNIAVSSRSFGIPKEVLAAVPISAEVFFGALFSILGSRIISRLGYKKSSVLGSILFTGGLVIRFILPDIWILTLGNSIMGCGWGILLLLINTAIADCDEEEKNRGFSGYTAAALNGVNCGIVFGGFLVNWLNHNSIFMIAAALSLVIAVLAGLYLTKVTVAAAVVQKQADQEIRSINVFQFLTNKNVLAFFIMITIPVVACSYFLNYLYPILGNEYGLSETRVGYSYLLNGLCVMFLSPVLTRYFSKKVKKAYSLSIASLIYAAAFLCIAVFHNLLSLIVVLILLGISDSFGLPLQTSYYTDLDAVKKYGYGKSIGVYSLFENISQSAGSFVFSYVLIIGVSKGLSIVLGAVAVLAVLFAVVNLIQGFGRREKVRGLNNVGADNT